MYDCHSSDNMIVNECKGWELGVGWLGLGGGCVGLVHTGWEGGSVPENGVGLVHCSSTSLQNTHTHTKDSFLLT